MTATRPTVRNAPTVGDVLGIAHEEWMEQITTFLGPAVSEEADFWSRWSGTRFLSDQFGDRFRMECALIEALGPLLPDGAAHTLAATRADLEHTLEELVATGRRRATGLLVARLTRRFIGQLALWCAEVELATDGIDTAELPPESSWLLPSLRSTHALSQ